MSEANSVFFAEKGIGALLLYQFLPLKKTVFTRKTENNIFLLFPTENFTTLCEKAASKISLLLQLRKS